MPALRTTSLALGLALLASPALASMGFTTYTTILEGADNTDALNSAKSLNYDSTVIYADIQINPGSTTHNSAWSDFTTLAHNTASAGKNISIIPRVAYGVQGNAAVPEPNNAEQVLADVMAWAAVLNTTKSIVNIPLVQAGFLGQWGEWHDGPLCPEGQRGTNQPAIKGQLLSQLLMTGLKVALRYPPDHKALVAPGDRRVTLHDDCIFESGPTGSDGGSFDDPKTGSAADAMWRNYTISVAGGNGFGGEPCDLNSANSFDWDQTKVCSTGSDGLIAYINTMKIAYLNPENPPQLQKILTDKSQTACTDAISKALKQWQ